MLGPRFQDQVRGTWAFCRVKDVGLGDAAFAGHLAKAPHMCI